MKLKHSLLMLVLLSASFAVADDVALSWDISPGASSYVVHMGTSPGVYPTVLSSTIPSLSIVGLAPQTRHYICVTAVNGAGASACSIEVSGWPRPIITSVAVTGVGPYRATIMGDNFYDDGTFGTSSVVATHPGMTITNASRVSASQIDIDYTLDSSSQSGSVNLTIINNWINPDQPSGLDPVVVVDSASWFIVVDIPLPPTQLQVD